MLSWRLAIQWIDQSRVCGKGGAVAAEKEAAHQRFFMAAGCVKHKPELATSFGGGLLTSDDLSSVRVKNLARHVRRIFAGQKQITGSHLVGLAGPAHRHVAAEALDLLFIEGRRNERGPYRPGATPLTRILRSTSDCARNPLQIYARKDRSERGNGAKRFSALRRQLGGIAPHVLVRHLRNIRQ
jgi:hypothetical protein